MKKKLISIQKRILKIIFFISSFLVIQSHGYCQIIVPPSPESSWLIREITHPANFSTGIRESRLNLYTINTSTIELSIDLIYHASGIKVQDIPGWSGLGWRLSSGGKITRVMKQKPDEIGYCNGDGNTASSIWTANAVTSRANGNFDGEPDLFYFELNGRTGMFVLDPDGNAYTIPYQKINIYWIDRTYFEIYDESGIKYTFGTIAQDTTRATINTGYDSKTLEFTSTWYLEKIETPNGNQLAFIYEPGKNLNYTLYNEKYSTRITNNTLPNPLPATNLNTIIQVKTPCYLKYITWSTGKLEFCSSDQSNAAWGRKLDEIKIFSIANEYLKTIKLNFSYSSSVEPRLCLDQIHEISPIYKKTLYRFEYHTTKNLPSRDTKDFDHWGYFNSGTTNNTINCPSITHNNQSTRGANRDPNLDATRANTLRRVYYAMGGFEEFEYELNQTPAGTLGGLRLKSIKKSPNKGNVFYTKRFGYHPSNTPDGSSGQSRRSELNYLCNINAEGYCTIMSRDLNEILGLHGNPAGYSTVTITNENGSRIVHDYSFAEDGQPEINTYSDAGSAMNSSAIFPVTSQSWKRGLLTTSTSYYADGREKEKITYQYSTENSVKKDITGYVPYVLPVTGQTIDPKLLGIYHWISHPIFLNGMTIVSSEQINTTTTYTYDQNYLLPVEISVNTSADNSYKTRYKYPFNYNVTTALATTQNAYALRMMLSRNMINTPVEEIQVKNNKIVTGSILEYKTIPTDNLPTAIVLDKKRELRITAPIPSTEYTSYSISPTGTPAIDSRYKSIFYADNYDAYGNLIQYHSDRDNNTAIVYGYNHSIPVAIIENASLSYATDKTKSNQVLYTSFEDHENSEPLHTPKTGRKAFRGVYTINLGNFKAGEYVLRYWKSKDNGKTWNLEQETLTVNGSPSFTIGSNAYCIDEVSVIPVEAKLTSYTYLPGIGLLSESDTNGATRYYQYDSFGLLIGILDSQRRYLKKYEYYLNN